MTRLHKAIAYLLSPLEEKRDPAAAAGDFRRLSMLRCAIAAFTVTMCIRLLKHDVNPMTWPEFAALIAILFAIPLSKYLDADGLKRLTEVLDHLTGSEDNNGE